MDQIIRDILCNVKEYLKGLTGDDRFFADKAHRHNFSEIDGYNCMHDNDCHTEEYATKTYTDRKDNDLQTAINGKSKVVFNSTLTTGTKIGSIKIDNNSVIPIYCEKNTDTIYEHPATHSTNMIKDPNAHNNIGSAAEATQSTINTKIDTELSKKSPTVTFTPTLTSNTSTKKIGEIKIGTTKTDLYCDKNTDTVYTHPDSLSNAISSGMYKFSANKQGHITGATGITQNDITALGIPNNNTATTTTAGLMSADDKDKLNGLSTYGIFLTDTEVTNVPTKRILEVQKGTAIWACVKKNRNTAQQTGDVDFIINGVTYTRSIDEDTTLARMNINLSPWQWNAYTEEFEPAIYTVIAIFRPNGWTEAIDIKQMKVRE